MELSQLYFLYNQRPRGDHMKLQQKIFTAFAFVMGVAVLPGAALAEQPVTLHGSAPAWANSSNFASAADPNENVGFRVYLGWSGADAAEALAHAVSDPKSSQYGQYLTPAQFRNQFAPSQAQVAAVQSWLKSQGFSVIYTPTNNHYVAAEGTVAQAQAAFLTQFGMYNVAGKSVRSPSHDVAIPSSWASMSMASSVSMRARCSYRLTTSRTHRHPRGLETRRPSRHFGRNSSRRMLIP